MKQIPKDYHHKTVEEKSEYLNSLSDEELYNMTPSVSFLFYYTIKNEDESFLEKFTLWKNDPLNKFFINQIETWNDFLKWDDILGSQRIVNYIKSL